MNWLKHVILDVVISGLILANLFVEQEGLRYFIMIYTPFLLIARIAAFKGKSMQRQMRKTARQVPTWFYHLLYTLNTAALLVAGWWLMGVLWGTIWLLSWLNERRTSNTPQLRSAR